MIYTRENPKVVNDVMYRDPTRYGLSYDFTGVVQTNDGYGRYKDGRLHRDDGPAVENYSGRKAYYINGILDNKYGPGIIHSDGQTRWVIDGHILSKEEWREKRKELGLDKNIDYFKNLL